ncbi:thioredoxin domain-containing protein [Salinibacterium hongtaonis]|uniref:thioredoxin domain-containing protein n=1 Tax=Homoserinimonas hongtaonis TaxID=2079791 RepID=UPI000D355A82|nr:DUF255 domain-containing protein [Salinibacterium hongtaonis]AWB89833.1 thioredoxin domain-containing protein [Salinibacterium hongtaonis]
MSNHLADAVSPYLRSHADNPVDWWPWGEEAFAEAERRGVPVFISIGYSTCHWCHVMARESFEDAAVAAYLNDNFVNIKVDREEHPDVDASYLAAAAAFTQELGWPLSVFATPQGGPFFATTYCPPVPMQGHPSFSQVVQAVREAWEERPEGVAQNAATISEVLAQQSRPVTSDLPTDLSPVVETIMASEDPINGGFGGAPKFPVAPVLDFLLASGDERGIELACRTLQSMAESPLRDPVEGGFFRYATRGDWGDPHYERMLYDNAQLLTAAARAAVMAGPRFAQEGWEISEGIARFLMGVMQLPSGAFASAQDSESTVGGARTEGGYYRLDAEARAAETPPKLDDKVLTGWNGLAIEALAYAGSVFDRADWVESAARAADYLLEHHMTQGAAGDDAAHQRLVRASVDGRLSSATATLEDYGMFAGGLLQLALATGQARYATAGRQLIDATLEAAAGAQDAVFAVPGGADPVLAARGLAIALDLSEGAYPSGLSACAAAALTLTLVTGDARYREASLRASAASAGPAVRGPLGFGAALAVIARLAAGAVQLVVVTPDLPASRGDDLVAAARSIPSLVTAILTESQARTLAAAGFELFEAKSAIEGVPTAYLCRDFVCRLPVVSAEALRDVAASVAL